MTTPMKAIRAKCLDCCCGSANEVRNCPITECPIWTYRFGHNPAIKREKGVGDPSFGERMKARAQKGAQGDE